MPSYKTLWTFFLVALACNRSWAANPDSDSETEQKDGTLKPKKSPFQKMNQDQYKGWLNHALTREPDKDHGSSSGRSSAESQEAHHPSSTMPSDVKYGPGEHVSSYPLHRHLDKEHKKEQNEDILKKYEGNGKVPRPENPLPESRSFGSYPHRDPGSVTGIEKAAKERKANPAPWESPDKRGKGLGLPAYTTSEGWHPPGKEPPLLSRHGKEFKVKLPNGKPLGTWIHGDLLWKQNHLPKHEARIRHDRGDDHRLYHKHANSFVQVEPRLSTQSFNGREERSLSKDMQKFKAHHRQSLTSDGRYSGDGKFFGKSPLALGAEGARGASLLSKSLPPKEQAGYRVGQFSKQLRGKALEQEDGHFNIKAHSRLQNWMKQRTASEGLAKSQQREKMEEEQKKGKAAAYKQREKERAETKSTQREAEGHDPSKAPWQSFFPDHKP